jgi:hypothetical protein
VVGYLDRQFQAYQDKDKVLTVHGQYDSRNVGALLDHYRIRMVAFPSAGPETYCYTLTEAWQAGRPALVPPIGALGERVGATGAGWLMEDWQDEDRILNQILSILKPEHREYLDRAAQMARAVPLFSLARMAEDTERMYGRLVQTGARQPPMPNLRLHCAVKTASGREQEVAKRIRRTWRDRLFLALAHIALRLRYTLPGRYLYQVVPVRWQQGLKSRLLE